MPKPIQQRRFSQGLDVLLQSTDTILQEPNAE